jgi:hypothetical protein
MALREDSSVLWLCMAVEARVRLLELARGAWRCHMVWGPTACATQMLLGVFYGRCQCHTSQNSTNTLLHRSFQRNHTGWLGVLHGLALVHLTGGLFVCYGTWRFANEPLWTLA